MRPLQPDHKNAGGWQVWTDRCYLPLVVGVAVAICAPVLDEENTRIALAGGGRIAVARDLGAAVQREVRMGELLCLRLSNGVAVTVDFVDGRSPLVSADLPSARA